MKTKSMTWLFDILWVGVILAWIVILVIPSTRTQYLFFTGAHKYLGGFISFAVLATMGDLLAGRIATGKWTINAATFFKMLIWGFIGMAITLYFGIVGKGVTDMQKAHMIPFADSVFAHAFFTAALLNLSFGPAMFIFHKFTDAFINAKYNRTPSDINTLIESVDWKTFFKFTVFTTVPLFWIPCHTIDFLLPENYRVLFAAFLSIALGLLLSLKNKKKKK